MPSDEYTPTLRDVIAELEKSYPPTLAEAWDHNGLVAGNPDHPVRRVLFTVDLTRDIVREARNEAADLLVVHHPFLLRGVHTVAQTTAKGEILHELARTGEHGTAVYTTHTTADSARDGVSEVLARKLALTECVPLLPDAGDASLGLGRVGLLAEPCSVRQLTLRLRDVLPSAPVGVRVAGDPDTRVSRIAVCGGAGDSLLPQVVAADADAYITADLRHHVVQDHREQYGTVLIDAGHWATEQPWCSVAARALEESLSPRLSCRVSDTVTDPWSFIVTTS